jgi:SulP family sulfate permease
MLVATFVLYTLSPFDHGHFGIATLASKFGAHAIPQGFPPFHWPTVDWKLIRDLLQPATAIALLGAIESLLSVVVADGLAEDRHDSNTELIAQGISNLICPFFGGLPATGAIARTSANINNGAKSPIAGIVHSLTLLVIILVFAGLAGAVPIPVMSAVLFMVALRMGEWHELLRLRILPRSDAVVLFATFALRQPLEMLRKAGFIEVIGRENLCAHFDAALVRAKGLLS